MALKIRYCGNAAARVLLSLTVQNPLIKDLHKTSSYFLTFLRTANIHNKVVWWWGFYLIQIFDHLLPSRQVNQ